MVSDTDAKRRKPYTRKDLPSRWKEILVILMNEGSSNRYEITKALSGVQTYSTVHKAAKHLVDDGLISSVRRSKARTGLSVETYDLTVPGLAFALSYLSGKAKWDHIVRKHKNSLPEVFGRWEHFVKEGGEELAKKSLKESIGIFWDEYDWEAGCTNEQAAKKISESFIITPEGELTQEELSKWYRILAKDKQLRSWAAGLIERIIVQDLDEVEYWSRRLYDLRGSYPKRLTNRIRDVMERTS